jgi:hypothetical protein
VFKAAGAARNSAMAPSRKPRKDLPQMSSRQSADVVVTACALTVSRPAANFFRRIDSISSALKTAFCDAVTDAATNNAGA